MIDVLPATGRFDDVSAVLRPRSNPDKACWCLTYRLSPAELNTDIPGSRPAAMRELCSRDPGPGLVAYLDGTPVGWCGVGPRSEFHRLTRSRTIQQLDDLPVCSVVCLVVAPGHRGKGIAASMLERAGCTRTAPIASKSSDTTRWIMRRSLPQ
jgi:GNAT superfamily N-acetyltransferase